jgi:phage terminase small subunit
MRKLTPKQQAFVGEYLIDFNGTAAAIRAGYSARTAQQQASRLLLNVVVQAAIREGRARVAQRAEVKAADVLAELALIGFSDIGQVLDFTGLVPALKDTSTIPEAARRAIAGVKVKRYIEGSGDDAREVEMVEFKLWNKNKALEDLARHLGLLKERVEVSGEVKLQHGLDLAKLSHEQLEHLKGIVGAARAVAGRPGPGGAADGRGS